MDCRLPASSVHGISQARVLEWVAFSFSRGSSQPRDQTQVFRNAGTHFTIWATREAPGSYKSSNHGNRSSSLTSSHSWSKSPEDYLQAFQWFLSTQFLVVNPFQGKIPCCLHWTVTDMHTMQLSFFTSLLITWYYFFFFFHSFIHSTSHGHFLSE